jgi:hypothetical protein
MAMVTDRNGKSKAIDYASLYDSQTDDNTEENNSTPLVKSIIGKSKTPTRQERMDAAKKAAIQRRLKSRTTP